MFRDFIFKFFMEVFFLEFAARSASPRNIRILAAESCGIESPLHIDQIIPLPAGYHHVRLNKDGVLGILTGVGTAKAAASVMAVGHK